MIELFEPLTKPTAARLNALGASQSALAAVAVGAGLNAAAAEWGGSGSVFYFVRRLRWLLFNSSGQLEDPAGVNEPVSLRDPEDASQVGVLDLESVAWLGVGRVYRVKGVAVCWEQEAL
jgi:hypothetical protein